MPILREVIPEGNYGAGTVMVWDKGTYRNIKEKNGKLISMQQCLKLGTIEVFLEGTKLKGAYALVRMRGQDSHWLLIKMKDDFANTPRDPIKTKTKSALTGRTTLQIKRWIVFCIYAKLMVYENVGGYVVQNKIQSC